MSTIIIAAVLLLAALLYPSYPLFAGVLLGASMFAIAIFILATWAFFSDPPLG